MVKKPDAIGKYKVQEMIAQGGMGAVFKAIHPTLKRPVIIKKLILRGNRDIAERFKREAWILMDFRHDQIVDMYDHFREGNSYYIVLEYVDGITVEKMIKTSRYLHNGTAAYILRQTALALKYAHEKEVVHRDIKPANILLSKKGEVKLVDFGIAATGDKEDDGLTREGMTLGTPGYMAPEQFQDTKNVDQRADVYSLGVLAYEMLTGKKPFPGGFSPELMNRIQRGKYLPPRQFNPGIPRPLVRFIRKMMKVKTNRRFRNMDPAIRLLNRFLKPYDDDELKQIVADAASGKKIQKPNTRKKVVLRRKISLIGLGAVFLVIAGVLGVRQGIFQEIFAAKSRGAVLFSITVPEGSQPVNKIYTSTELYRETEEGLEPMEMIPITYQRSITDGALELKSRPRYLPAGHYRVRFNVEDEITWNSFTVLPRQQQKKNSATKKGLIIAAGSRIYSPVPLKITIRVRDAVDGNVLDDARIRYIVEGEEKTYWQMGEILSGTTLHIRISHGGYQTEDYIIETKKQQNILMLDAGLVPEDFTFEAKEDTAEEQE